VVADGVIVVGEIEETEITVVVVVGALTSSVVVG